ncbi:Metallothionein expression activator [Diplodia seriata]|uniref:Metallothionein expression activator n=1 Tax=Diplodia seriata TaxID=420778 RepID=A0A1S8BHK0_9PEZI|nr:Metallothionein expression activator [Diplodia seriata]
MSHYDSDDAYPKSPGLQPIKIKSTPSPSPPPFPPQHSAPVITQTVSSNTSSSRRRKRNNRTRPSQGDTVLLSFLEPNRPDIARVAGERALNSDSDPDASESEDEAPRSPMQTGDRARSLAQAASKILNGDGRTTKLPLASTVAATVTEIHDTDMDRHSPKSRADDQPARKGSDYNTGLPTPENFPKLGSENFPKLSSDANSMTKADHSPATSPNLRELAIPDSQASPDERLPALQNPTSPHRDSIAGSPNQSLPSFRHLSEIAEQATQENEHRASIDHRASFSHRPSISSTGAPALSPTLVSRFPPNGNSRRSPPTQFPPLNPLSPVNSHTGADIKLSPPSTYSHYASSRRHSSLSDTSNTAFPPPLTLSTTSTNESYGSRGSDAYAHSPPTRPRSDSHRMSIDGITHPNPAAQIQHVPPHGSTGFKCDYPGCNAPPFQTQYLLNSHANVHSQARPHYCPVPGCSRGEGGKGFKRKNEMIRHGLVHDSPGYVCPFCPERDHKYPRPDNLQRHVRVHHVDKDKDDAQLREVLAQRPEGGGRGRRRRIGS